jgi:hypothetical protein
MPIEWRISFSQQIIDTDTFAVELRRSLRRLLTQAAGIYYNTIIADMPVDTGFLAGSFANLRNVTGASASPRGPKPQKYQKFYVHTDGSRTAKSTTTGIPFTSELGSILTEVSDGKTKLLVIFEFDNAIQYYPINDIFGSPKRPPWGLTEKATRAALNYINGNLAGAIEQAQNVSVKQRLIFYPPNGGPPRIIRESK